MIGCMPITLAETTTKYRIDMMLLLIVVTYAGLLIALAGIFA
jgi:hypothetical protein